MAARNELVPSGALAVIRGQIGNLQLKAGIAYRAAEPLIDFPLTGNDGKSVVVDPSGRFVPEDREQPIAEGTVADYWRGDKTWQVLNKAAVGLGNVDNTSDANKPVSTAQATALAAKLDDSQATASGLAILGAASAEAQRVLLRNACMVKKSAAETGINASAGNYLVSWPAEVYKDSAGYHDNAVNNSRLTTLAGQTRVRIGCTIVFANVTASSQLNITLYRNGVGTSYDGRPSGSQTTPSATIQPTMTLASGPIPVTGGTDYFEVALFCSDVSIDVTTNSYFWIEAC